MERGYLESVTLAKQYKLLFEFVAILALDNKPCNKLNNKPSHTLMV